jgi:hypothetical protein
VDIGWASSTKPLEKIHTFVDRFQQSVDTLERLIRQIERNPPGSIDSINVWVASLNQAKRQLRELLRQRRLRATNLWETISFTLDLLRTRLGFRMAPPPVDDHRTLGSQLDYLDDLQNRALAPMSEIELRSGG